MTAVTAARDTEIRPLKENFYLTVKTGESIYEKTLCVLDSSGELNAATTGTSFKGGFVAMETIVSAPAGTKIKVQSNRCAKFANGDSITNSSIGDAAYAFDNATVKKTATGLSPCGQIVQVDSDGVWVQLTSVLVSGLAAANNLSDVGNAATARLNLKANRLIMQMEVADLTSASALVYRAVYPVTEDGTIKKIYSVIDGALTVGDATLTGKIGATPITTGVITITQAGSAAGDVDTCSPSAANVLSQGNVLSLTVGGTNTAAKRADCSFEIWT